ncbi:hypothetical protein VE01_00221 [Pseudogymnoascus verrucosus]|uniref:Pyrroloquinoline quinone-dependent pyranose dehydrogenase beta-propeller domain-containing protein n=1 Tax=Pseudogymnoascus verrucosus TaxID=342668 RepID=A0A2P2SXY6_9PEZI|nr:uncharacterized protein VE01_00221 [Pseudogymnoascus verrucosus]OBU01675.1 hypothetical protein VE01_00221 [Pseudogymnoascus verrucosus]
MHISVSSTALLASLAHILTASAQDACPGALTPSYAQPVFADGWTGSLVAKGLTRPRGMQLDSQGNLLVVQQGVGIVHLQFTDGGGTCLTLAKKTTLITDSVLNHGIGLSEDGKTLYASSVDAAFSWPYDAEAVTLGTKSTIVTGMNNAGHSTRTILLSKKEPGWLILSRGSAGNIDPLAEDKSSGHSHLKAFNIANLTASSPPYDFTADGRILGWGMRNAVGVGEEPTTGGIFTVENSADNVARSGTDIHATNPGEEMNFVGTLASTENQGGNYGYPNCLAVWNTDIPNIGSMTVGSQFAVDVTDQTTTVTDADCEERVKPRLTFEPHTAPLDVKFAADGSKAFVSFHGSWNSPIPVGYRVAMIDFANGQPVAAADSQTAAVDLFTNSDITKCPSACFRPAGLFLDGTGRLFVSSDATGEIWILGPTSSTTPTPPATSGGRRRARLPRL